MDSASILAIATAVLMEQIGIDRLEIKKEDFEKVLRTTTNMIRMDIAEETLIIRTKKVPDLEGMDSLLIRNET